MSTYASRRNARGLDVRTTGGVAHDSTARVTWGKYARISAGILSRPPRIPSSTKEAPARGPAVNTSPSAPSRATRSSNLLEPRFQGEPLSFEYPQLVGG